MSKTASLSKNFIFIILVALQGCAATTSSESNKASGYDKKPESVFVLFPSLANSVMANGVDSVNGVAFVDGFNGVFSGFMMGCNIALQANYKNQKIETPQEAVRVINASKPDWILEIAMKQITTAQKTMYGIPVGVPQVSGVSYNFTLLDRIEKRKVWRANINVRIKKSLFSDDPKQGGHDVAVATIKKMQEDGLLTSCGVLPD